MIKKLGLTVILAITLLTGIFLIKIIPILKQTFPLENTDAVLFTLSQNVDGSRDFVITLFQEAFLHSFVITIVILLVFCCISRFLRLFSYKKSLLFTVAAVYSWFAYSAYTQLPLIEYFAALQNVSMESEHSDFYASEYVNPDSVRIHFGDKQNLVLVFLESMEYNFQDSSNGGNLSENAIPEITEYMKNGQSFIPGGTQIWGTGWTMADIVAKTCGIPLTFPPSISNQIKPIEKFLPGTTCLTDILIQNGYNVVVSQGSNLNFSGMNTFLKTHSSPLAFGLMEYAQDERVKNDTVSFWGVKDRLHYELVKEKISLLAKQEKPWAMWLFTIDTHSPYGYLDPDCTPDSPVKKEDQYPFVLRCSSKQLKQFIEWSKKQEWYENTTFAIMGDHATMTAPGSVGFKDSTINHYWLDFFLNSVKSTDKVERRFSSMDIFPTILESMGAEIPGAALGLGRSLFSSEPTLLEKYGLDSLNSALKKRSVEYDYFLYFDRK